jgi:hypothetical protein
MERALMVCECVLCHKLVLAEAHKEWFLTLSDPERKKLGCIWGRWYGMPFCHDCCNGDPFKEGEEEEVEAEVAPAVVEEKEEKESEVVKELAQEHVKKKGRSASKTRLGLPHLLSESVQPHPVRSPARGEGSAERVDGECDQGVGGRRVDGRELTFCNCARCGQESLGYSWKDWWLKLKPEDRKDDIRLCAWRIVRNRPYCYECYVFLFVEGRRSRGDDRSVLCGEGRETERVMYDRLNRHAWREARKRRHRKDGREVAAEIEMAVRAWEDDS